MPDAGPGAGEPNVGRNQAQGAQKDVAVECEEPAQTLGVDQFAPADVTGTSATDQHEAQTEKASDPFRTHGGGGDAGDAPVPP